jgi:hypothetical protein
MARRPAAEARYSYLVEHYRPGLDVEQLRHSVSRVRDTVVDMEREGTSIRHLRFTIVPVDESFLCLIEAASEQLVREAYARAGVPFERISLALSDGAD